MNELIFVKLKRLIELESRSMFVNIDAYIKQENIQYVFVIIHPKHKAWYCIA